MEATREIVTPPHRPETRWWAICIALALGIHAAAAAALLARWNAEPNQVANAPLILVELEPLPVAPDTKPAEAPPGPQQQQAAAAPARPQPVEKTAEAPPQQTAAPPQPAPQKPAELTAALPPEPKAELQIAGRRRRNRSKSRKKRPLKSRLKNGSKSRSRRSTGQKQASLASAPSSGRTQGRARGGAGAGRFRHAIPTRCRTGNRNWSPGSSADKRYPAEAQSRGEQGVAQLAFSVDRSGGVHHARIVRSSGSGLLDARRWRCVERAAPLPPPPPEISGAQIAISVPIRYNMR